jgi:alpha-glucoside transport system substrate-binding protein
MTRTLVLATVLALTATLPACAGRPQDGGSVTVLGPWTDTEGREFRGVLDMFERKTGIDVDYRDARAVTQVLRANVQAGTPPDVAILSSPGQLVSYIRDSRLHRLDGVIARKDRDAFRKLWMLPQDGHVYAVPVKANLKSLVWYRPDQIAKPVPQTWDELMAYSQNIVNAGGTPWCMGMGDAAGSGWPGTDMIEDAMLRQSGPEVYRQWAAGELPWRGGAVEQAWRTWGAIAGDPRFVRGGPKTALLTDFGDAGRPMFTDPPRCYLEFQASFVMSIYRDYGTDKKFDFLPRSGTDETAWTSSADLAAMFKDTPQTRALMRFLATDAQSEWPNLPGSSAFTVKKNVKVDRDPVSNRIEDILQSAKILCFDAADVMPPTMSAAFNRAVLEYLNDPSQLDTVLVRLDRVRTTIAKDEWVNLPCS